MVINSGHELLNQRKITTSGLAYSAVSGAIAGIIGEVVPEALRKVGAKRQERRYAEYWRKVAAGESGHLGMSNAEYAKWMNATEHLDAEIAYGKVNGDELLELRKTAIKSDAGWGGYQDGLKINYIVLNTSSADDVNKIFKETMGYEG